MRLISNNTFIRKDSVFCGELFFRVTNSSSNSGTTFYYSDLCPRHQPLYLREQYANVSK